MYTVSAAEVEKLFLSSLCGLAAGCMNKMSITHPDSGDHLTDWMNCASSVQSLSLLQGLFEWLWVLSWIGASIPLYMMCCCTAKPSPSEIALTRMPTTPAKQQIQAEYEYESLLSAKI
jgi:hypothetical protein